MDKEIKQQITNDSCVIIKAGQDSNINEIKQDVVNIPKLQISEIKLKLKDLGLKQSGTKDEIMKRLDNAISNGLTSTGGIKRKIFDSLVNEQVNTVSISSSSSSSRIMQLHNTNEKR
jgi:hypothetical protein